MQKIFKSVIVAILTWEARMLIRRHKPFIVAVTGSVGKTTTKDAIFQVLKDTTSVRKSEKSFNSELGVPLTILGLPSAWHDPLRWALYLKIGLWRAFMGRAYPDVLVLEVGVDHPGDIAKLTSWLTPDIAVVTRLPERPVHVEYFPSPEALRKEKGVLVQALSPDGVCIANGDDHYVRDLCTATRARTIAFGFNNDCHVRGSTPEVRYEETSGGRTPLGMSFRVEYEGKSFPVQLSGALGVQQCFAALAALAVGVARGESMARMTAALGTLETPPGRMRIIPGKNGAVLIDDSYNSSPVAAEAALQTLRTIEAKRKIALLGDMLELGEFAEEEHRTIGRLVDGSAEELVVIGTRARWIAEGAAEAGLTKEKIHEFTDSEEAGKWMAEHVRPGDVILAKGSQGSGANMIRMERAVKMLMAHPEDAAKLLVRQEDEWSRY